jgi:SAM-dependent methyltransferase
MSAAPRGEVQPDEARPGRPPRAHPPSRLELLRLFARLRRDPAAFFDALARWSLARFPFQLAGARVLDLGSGGGEAARALARAGAAVVPLELDEAAVRSVGPPPRQVVGDAGRLPFRDGVFDGVFCSNLLEHVRDPAGVLAEIGRVLRPGGWAWVSWTNWYSPVGGHEIVPFHYLGPRLGSAVWRRLFGEPALSVPFESLWPVHVGRTLALARALPGMTLVDARPRYYPSQRWIVRVPLLREFATWNCLLLFERR